MNTAPRPAGRPIAREDRSRLAGFCEMPRRIARDQGGAIAVIFALMFPVVAGILGFRIETGIWYAIKRQDQSVADIAAYSGALEVLGDSTKCTTGACPAAVKDALTNGFDFADPANTASTVCVGTKCTPSSSSSTTVTVTLRHDETPKMVSYFLGKNTFQIGNQAVASVTSSPACASSVGGSGTGLSLDGTTALTMPGCTLTSNSTSADSIEFAGNTSVDAFSIYTAGGVSGKGNATLTLTQGAQTFKTPLPNTYCLSAANCVRVPSSVTTFAMPTLPSSVTTFPTLASAQTAPPNTKFAAAPSGSVSSTPPSGKNACDTTVLAGSEPVSDLSKFNCYLNPTGVTLSGSGPKLAFKAGSYYFTGPVTITGNGTIASGVDIYVLNGSITVASSGIVAVAKNGGKGGGSKAGDNIWIVNGSFDASAGTVTFNNASGGDTTNTSAYAIQASSGIKFGNATFNSGEYAFYGSGLTIGGTSAATRTALGPANYYVDAGGVTVPSNLFAGFTASVTNAGTGNATNLTINSGNFTSNGTLTFNNSGTSGVTYSLKVPSGGNYTVSAGSTTFGANTKLGLYGGGLTISSGANAGFNAGVNFYLDSGSLTANGCAAFQGGTSTININAGSLTGGSTGSLNFNPNTTVCGVPYTTATSQYNINTGGSGHGVTLGGPAALNPGTYYFMNSSTSGTGVAVSAGSPTFAGGIYSVQNGGFSVANGATASFAAGTPCAPTGGSPPTGSCVYLANGAFSNAGTATFATGNYYLYDPNGSGTSFTNSGTMTLGTTASSNFYINNGGGAFSNASGATMNFGVGSYYIQDGASANGNNSGGFASSGTLNFTGGSGSNYYFINGPSFGTGTSSGTCSNSTTIFGALSLMSASHANFGPADYYLLNGDLCINQDKGTAPVLTCGGVAGGPACAPGGSGITFILTGNGGSYPSNVSTLQIPDPINTNQNATTGLNAPVGTPDGAACNFTTIGCYAGILFLQDPDYSGTVAQTSAGTISGGSCSNHSNCSFLDGGDAMALTGAVFVPQSVIDFKSNNSANTCLVIIAEAIIFSGNSFLTATNCTQDNVKLLRSGSVAMLQ